MVLENKKIGNRSLERNQLATIGGTAGLGFSFITAHTARAELVEVNYQSFGMLPGGSMRLVTADGRTVVLNPSEFTFIDGRIYLDTSALARVQFNASSNQAGADGSWLDSSWLLANPIAIASLTTAAAGTVWGAAEIFGWFGDNSTPGFAASGLLPAASLSKGTSSGAILVADLSNYFTPADGDISYSLTVTREDGSIASNLFAVNNGTLYTLETVDVGNIGEYKVTIHATDTGDDEVANQQIIVSFVGEDPFQSSGTMPTHTVADASAAGSVLVSDLSQYFTAADGEISYSLSVVDSNGANTNSMFAVNNGALFTLETASAANAGTYTVFLTAKDTGDMETATQSFVIIVEGEVNIEPNNTIPGTSVSEDTPSGSVVLSTLSPYFKNAEGTVTYAIRVTNEFGAEVNNVLGLLNDQVVTLSDATSAFEGLYTVTLTATDSDGGDTASQTFTVMFLADDFPPTVDQGISNQTVQENAAFNFSIPSDVFKDDEGIVTYTVENLPTGLTFDAVNRTITGAPTESGTFLITVKGGDIAGQEVSTTFNIFVTDINDAPNLKSGVSSTYVLDNVGGDPLDNGDPFVLDLTTLVEDEEGDTLTFSTTTTLPATYKLTSSGVLSGTADDTDLTVVLKAVDGKGGELDFNVLIDVAGVDPNSDPNLKTGVSSPYVISTAADQSALNFGDIMYFDLNTIVEDVDGDNITYTSSNIGNYPNANGGLLDLTPAGILTGIARDTQFSLSVTASDGVGGTLSFIIDLAVV